MRLRPFATCWRPVAMRRKLKPQRPQLHSLQPRLRQRRRVHSLQPPCCQRPRPPRQAPRCGMTPQETIGIAQTSTLGKRPMPSSWPRVVRTATLIAWTPTAMACPARACRVPHRSGIRLVVTPLANAGIESTRYGEYNAEYPAAPYSQSQAWPEFDAAIGNSGDYILVRAFL